MEENIEFVGRERISEDLRWKVLKRDKYRCRYCGKDSGPFHMDHVYPVVKGGETSINNLVTACDKCNMKKHDAVGVFPLPIGYFDQQARPGMKLALVILFGVWAIANASYFADEGMEVLAMILFIVGILISHYGVVRLMTVRMDEEI